MRNLSLFGCVLALIVSSGCQSGSNGFRNPFKDQFARTFPNSFPKLMTKSKDPESEKRGEFDLGGVGAAEANAGVPSVSDSAGSSDMTGNGQVSQVEAILERGDAAYVSGIRQQADGNPAPAAESVQQATGLYRQALALDPYNVHAHHRLAIIHDQQHDYVTAEQHYQAALKVEPENVSILNDLGYSYYLQNRFEDSKRYLEYILKVDRGNQLAMGNLALVHAAEGDVQQAYVLFQQSGLDSDQSRQMIQQAIARANEGKATAGGSRMGVASTSSQPPGTSSLVGVAAVERSNTNENYPTNSESLPGRARTQSPRGDTFRPRPDLESAYGLSAHQPSGNPEPAMRTQLPASQLTAQQYDPMNAQPSFAQQERPTDYAVERVSYSTPSPRQTSEEEFIRLALNTGYGNLFPVISPAEYDYTQQATADFGVYDGTGARNAYYEQFGRPNSTTPHVVHADAVRPANGGASADRMRNVSYQSPSASSYGSPRIQSPSDQSYQQGTATAPVPTNRFPVTQSPGQDYYRPGNYSQFPNQERPPFTGSGGSTDMTQNPGGDMTGTRTAPTSPTSVPQYGGGVGAGCYIIDEPPPSDTAATSYNDGLQASPMSEAARKAHELALERYRRQMQQQ